MVRVHGHELAVHHRTDLHRRLARLARNGIEQDLPEDVQVERLAEAVHANPVRFGFLEREPELRDQLLGAWAPEHSARLPELFPAGSGTDPEADEAAAERQSWTNHFGLGQEILDGLPESELSALLTQARSILHRLALGDLRPC